jgi:preprotein translocase subunit SecG
MVGSMFGSRKASDLLTKITIGFGAVILLLSLITNKFFMSSTIVEERAPATLNAEKPTNIPAAPAPAKSAPVQAAPAQQSK